MFGVSAWSKDIDVICPKVLVQNVPIGRIKEIEIPERVEDFQSEYFHQSKQEVL